MPRGNIRFILDLAIPRGNFPELIYQKIDKGAHLKRQEARVRIHGPDPAFRGFPSGQNLDESAWSQILANDKGCH